MRLADVQKITKTCNITYSYVNEDTRTIKLPNAKSLTSADSDTVIARANDFGQYTLSDKKNATTAEKAYSTVVGGSVVEQVRTQLDLTQE